MDWRKHSDYEFTKKLTGEGWAWQFLRRNESYRLEFGKALFEFTEQPRPAEHGWIPEDPLDPEFIIPAPYPSRIQTYWGLPAYLNPALDFPANLMVFPADSDTGKIRTGTSFAFDQRAIQEERRLLLDLKPNQVAAVFDLTRPLVRQMERTERHLRFQQEELSRWGIIQVSTQRRRDRRRWTMYLMLLDASRESVGPAEFAKTVAYDRRKPKAWKKLNPASAWAKLQEAEKMTSPDQYRNLCF